MYKQAAADLQKNTNATQLEDNIYYVYQLHKNIAQLPYYDQIIKDDPLSKEDFPEEDYRVYFEENYNEIGNQIINYVVFLVKTLDETNNELVLTKSNLSQSQLQDEDSYKKQISKQAKAIEQLEMALEHSENRLKKAKEQLSRYR